MTDDELDGSTEQRAPITGFRWAVRQGCSNAFLVAVFAAVIGVPMLAPTLRNAWNHHGLLAAAWELIKGGVLVLLSGGLIGFVFGFASQFLPYDSKKRRARSDGRPDP